MAPPSPISFFRRFTVVMVLFTLRHFQPVLSKRLAARMLCRTIAQLRSLRAPHLDKRAKVTASCAPLVASPAVELSLPWCACEEMRNDTMTCHRVPCTCVLAAGAVIFFGVVAHARSCRLISCWISCLPYASVLDAQHKIPLRPALFLYLANSSSSGAARLPQKHKPHQHGLRRHDHVVPHIEPECGSCLTWCDCVYLCVSAINKGKKKQNKHHYEDAACSCDES